MNLLLILGLLLKDKLGHFLSTPVYTEHIPYSQSQYSYNTKDYNNLHDLVPAYVISSSHHGGHGGVGPSGGGGYGGGGGVGGYDGPSGGHAAYSRHKRKLEAPNISEMISVASGHKPYKLRTSPPALPLSHPSADTQQLPSSLQPKTYQQLLQETNDVQPASADGFWESLIH